MRRFFRFSIGPTVVSAMILFGCVSDSGDSETAQPSAGETQVAEGFTGDGGVSVLYEDERVRVLEMKLAAGTTDGLHSHPDEAAYVVKGSTDIHAIIVELIEPAM